LISERSDSTEEDASGSAMELSSAVDGSFIVSRSAARWDASTFRDILLPSGCYV
jgi:hypothetical protein